MQPVRHRAALGLHFLAGNFLFRFSTWPAVIWFQRQPWQGSPEGLKRVFQRYPQYTAPPHQRRAAVCPCRHVWRSDVSLACARPFPVAIMPLN